MVEQEEHETIRDESKTGFESTTDKGLVQVVDNYGHNFEKATLEMNRRLKKSIDNFNKNSSKQTQKMINLTYWIMGLTVLLGILAVIQIVLLLK